MHNTLSVLPRRIGAVPAVRTAAGIKIVRTFDTYRGDDRFHQLLRNRAEISGRIRKIREDI